MDQLAVGKAQSHVTVICPRCRSRLRGYYRPSEVAARLDIGLSTVYRLIQRRVLPAFVEPVTGTVRISIDEFEKYLVARQAPTHE